MVYFLHYGAIVITGYTHTSGMPAQEQFRSNLRASKSLKETLSEIGDNGCSNFLTNTFKQIAYINMEIRNKETA